MQRTSAKKSRHGCKECKRRHVKCDESRPSCVNCQVRQLPCSFLSSLPTGPATSSPNPIAASPSGSNHELTAPLSLAGPTFTVNSLVSTDQTFRLYHLELLHNFRTGVLGNKILDPAAVDGYMAMTVGEATQAPYLMDQLLAVSAANMSTKRPHQRRFYQDEATHLQTRGLALFNAAQAAAENALAGFVFSTLLSQQVLFDAFSTRSDFPTFLDKLVTSFHICGGVRIMTGQSWPVIMAQYQNKTGISLPGEFIAGNGSETMLTMKLARLETLLAGEDLSPSVLSPCNTALRLLRDISYAPPTDRPRFSAFRTTRVFQWAVQVPTSFIELLEQRRPESLIITAYYALLIHDTKHYWAYGDAGAFIIHSITKFLGSYWAEWLAWPNEVLDSVDRANRVGSSSPIDINMQCRIDELP
ncbi:hypothetical protein F4801DRAFT_545549 [Xylaria longipes]|nr:hypothetical protein F4801DRAFT_545549 [Xylaria longipes]RYC63666.1 hypothetical protein CHU98_g2536 [Xylaria longipes]